MSAKRSSFFWWTKLDPEQLYRSVFIDCYTKHFLIPRFLALIYTPYRRGPSHASVPRSFIMYGVRCTMIQCTHMGQSETPDTFYPSTALERDLFLSSELTLFGRPSPMLLLQAHMPSFLHGAEASHSGPQALLPEPAFPDCANPQAHLELLFS